MSKRRIPGGAACLFSQWNPSPCRLYSNNVALHGVDRIKRGQSISRQWWRGDIKGFSEKAFHKRRYFLCSLLSAIFTISYYIYVQAMSSMQPCYSISNIDSACALKNKCISFSWGIMFSPTFPTRLKSHLSRGAFNFMNFVQIRAILW